jgi:hypothetical protein
MYDMLGCKDNAKRKKPEGAGEAECAKPGGTEKYPEKKRKVARLRNGVQPHTKRPNQRSVGALASVLDAPVSQKPVPPLLVPAAGGRAEDPRPSGTSPIPPCPPGFFCQVAAESPGQPSGEVRMYGSRYVPVCQARPPPVI